MDNEIGGLNADGDGGCVLHAIGSASDVLGGAIVVMRGESVLAVGSDIRVLGVLGGDVVLGKESGDKGGGALAYDISSSAIEGGGLDANGGLGVRPPRGHRECVELRDARLSIADGSAFSAKSLVGPYFADPPKSARCSPVRNRTLTLIEREDDTRSWGNFLVYFSHSTTMPCPPRGWGYIFIGC
jgi:hypothetical protein